MALISKKIKLKKRNFHFFENEPLDTFFILSAVSSFSSNFSLDLWRQEFENHSVASRATSSSGWAATGGLVPQY